MGHESIERQTAAIVAVVTLSHHKVEMGEGILVEARNEEEQKKLTVEMAKTVKGDVAQLSNGIYLIIKS
jgi:hypothetical protein